MKYVPKHGDFIPCVLTPKRILNKCIQDQHWSSVMTPLTANGACLCLSCQQYRPQKSFLCVYWSSQESNRRNHGRSASLTGLSSQKSHFHWKVPGGFVERSADADRTNYFLVLGSSRVINPSNLFLRARDS